jgi:hypothetical protein
MDHNCTKAAIFLPCNKDIDSEGIATLYAMHVFPHFGIPQRIILDWDLHFTSKFSKELCIQLPINQNISTVYYPQTDKQSERSNQWLEKYLRIYGNFQQDD